MEKVFLILKQYRNWRNIEYAFKNYKLAHEAHIKLVQQATGHDKNSFSIQEMEVRENNLILDEEEDDDD